MLRVTRIQSYTSHTAESASHVWRYAASQPSWIARAALLTFLIVVGVPILLLVLIALLLAALVFTALAVLSGIWRRMRGALPRHDGRENVRIVRKEWR